MASLPVAHPSNPGIVAAHRARVADHGSGSHAYLDALAANNGPLAARDLADAVHLLCAVHGNFPGLADMVLAGADAGLVRDWLRDAADSFERERLYLVRLTSAVGPVPSTPGAAQTESALLSQRHAIETLAKSERRGCALGAAVALVQDWQAVRPVLDRAAERCGIDRPASTLPDDTSVSDVIVAGTDGLASERAFAFGAEQLLLQHRALFDLLAARADAREDY
jgi:hypothetical protein